RLDTFRQAPANRRQVLEHATPRPVQVGSILEDHIDERVAHHALAAYVAHVRRREKRGDDGISDLVLDQIGTTSRPLRRDDDLRVREVRNGVERRVRKRMHPPRHARGHGQQREKGSARTGGDDARDHGALSGARSRLSAATRKLPEVTTVSPALSPDSTAYQSSALAPSFTSRGSRRPPPALTKTSRPSPLKTTAEAGTPSP